MNRFVIWNLDKKQFVAPAGQQSSFTRNLIKARSWSTRAAAEAECCGNERVSAFEDHLT